MEQPAVDPHVCNHSDHRICKFRFAPSCDRESVSCLCLDVEIVILVSICRVTSFVQAWPCHVESCTWYPCCTNPFGTMRKVNHAICGNPRPRTHSCWSPFRLSLSMIPWSSWTNPSMNHLCLVCFPLTLTCLCRSSPRLVDCVECWVQQVGPCCWTALHDWPFVFRWQFDGP